MLYGPEPSAMQKRCKITRRMYNPLLSHWDKTLKVVHQGDEASKALLQRGQRKHTQPWGKQRIKYGRLDDEAQVVEQMLPALAMVPPFMAGKGFLYCLLLLLLCCGSGLGCFVREELRGFEDRRL
jgi:hypothetical protein